MEGFNWLLLVVIAALIVGGVFGGKKGFVTAVFSLVSTLLIIILTIVICPITCKTLKNNEKIVTPINAKVDQIVDLRKIYDDWTKNNSEKAETEKTEEITNETPTNNVVDTLLKQMGIPSAIRKMVTGGEGLNDSVKSSVSKTIESKLDDAEKYVVDSITGAIINAIGFVVTFIIVCLAVFIVGKILDVVSKLPIINGINKVAGVAAGAFEALLIVWFLFAVVTMFAATDFGQYMLSLINKSKILSFIYEHNIISTKIFKQY